MAKKPINKGLSDALGGGMIQRGPKNGAPLGGRKKSETDAVPADMMRIDPETGELCIGDDCFSVRIDTESNAVTLDMDESAEN